MPAELALAAPAAIPGEIVEWLDRRSFRPPSGLRAETVAALPGWIAAARAEAAPAARNDILRLFRLLAAALPPQFGMVEKEAIPLYLRGLADLPAQALPDTLDDLLRSMKHFPTIAHIREAAQPHANRLHRRRLLLERLQAAHDEAARRGADIPEVWESVRW
ncbi:MAG: hypothetical protein OXE57_10880 [Alphaproteobacteria bacterium]|nr:hypothetical protein [Alphaproteobacteria bacterium]